MIENRAATREELDVILTWAAEEGWNPGVQDAQAFYAADADGFFVATHQGTPVAAISVVVHNAIFAFLGLYIVRPEYRGQGIGLGLWQHALMHAGDRTIGLDGVPDQQDNYRASGFVHAGGTTRFSGGVPARNSAAIQPAKSNDVARLIAMEAQASGVSKPTYLAAWFEQQKTRQTFVTVDGTGLCTVRQCREGAKIGPLIAETVDTARQMIEHTAGCFDGPLIIDVPTSSDQLAQLCDGYGMQSGFKTARMYRGPFQATPHPFFAVTTLELG